MGERFMEGKGDLVQPQPDALPEHGRKVSFRAKLALTVAGVATAVSGCAFPFFAPGAKGENSPAPSGIVETSNLPIPTPISSENPTIVVPTASPSEKPTPKPSAEVPTFTEAPDGKITWIATDPEANNYGETMTAPDFNGIKPQIKDSKIEYIDTKGEA